MVNATLVIGANVVVGLALYLIIESVLSLALPYNTKTALGTWARVSRIVVASVILGLAVCFLGYWIVRAA